MNLLVSSARFYLGCFRQCAETAVSTHTVMFFTAKSEQENKKCQIILNIPLTVQQRTFQ